MSEIKRSEGPAPARAPLRPPTPPAGQTQPKAAEAEAPAQASRSAGDGVAVKRSLTGTLALPEQLGTHLVAFATPGGPGAGALGLKVDGPTLARHDSGPEVQALQSGLNRLGVAVKGEPIVEDRRFGAQTEAGVAGFQKQAQLPVDGKADPGTKAAMEAANLLIQAEKAMETAGAEQAVVTKALVDQAQRFLESLPPSVAKPLREQAIKLQEKVQKEQELRPVELEKPIELVDEKPPTEEELAAQEEAARKQAAADAATTSALQSGMKANTDAQLALQLAEKALAEAEVAASLGDSALAMDKASLAEGQAAAAVAAAQLALAELSAAAAEAPDPEAFEAKLAKAQELLAQALGHQLATAQKAETAKAAALDRNAAFAEAQSQAVVTVQLQQGTAEAALGQAQKLMVAFGEEATQLAQGIDAQKDLGELQSLLKLLEGLGMKAAAVAEVAKKAHEKAQAAQNQAPEGYALADGVAKARQAAEAAQAVAKSLARMLETARKQLREAMATRQRRTGPLPEAHEGDAEAPSALEAEGLPWPLPLEALAQALREGQPESDLVFRHAWLQGGLGAGPWPVARLKQLLLTLAQACVARQQAPEAVLKLLAQALAQASRLAPQGGFLDSLQREVLGPDGAPAPWLARVAALAFSPRQAIQLPRAEGLALAKLLHGGHGSPEEVALKGDMLAQVAARASEAAAFRQALGWLAKGPQAQQAACVATVASLKPKGLASLPAGILATLQDGLGPQPTEGQSHEAWDWVRSAIAKAAGP